MGISLAIHEVACCWADIGDSKSTKRNAVDRGVFFFFSWSCLGAVNHGQFVGSVNNICLVLASSAEGDMLLEQSNFCLTLSLFLIWNMITCTHHTIQTVLLYTIKNFISEIGFQVYLVYLLEKYSVLRFQRWAIGTGGMEQYIFSSDEVGKKATLY